MLYVAFVAYLVFLIAFVRIILCFLLTLFFFVDTYCCRLVVHFVH